MKYSNLFYLPFFAAEPPTMRLFATFEYPHPSSTVSKRPLMSDFIIAFDIASSPNMERNQVQVISNEY